MQMPKSRIPMLVAILFTCRLHAQPPLGYLVVRIITAAIN